MSGKKKTKRSPPKTSPNNEIGESSASAVSNNDIGESSAPQFPVKFELEQSITWGVKKGKFGKYSIPIVIDGCDEGDKGYDVKQKIEHLAKTLNAKNPFYATTLYLNTTKLTEKQKTELLDQERQYVRVCFKAIGTYNTKDKQKGLIFKCTKLTRLDIDDDAPED